MSCSGSECWPVTPKGIARAVGISVQRAHNIYQASKRGELSRARALPDPVWVGDAGQLWCFTHQILPWAERTNRKIHADPRTVPFERGDAWEPRVRKQRTGELNDFLKSRGAF